MKLRLSDKMKTSGFSCVCVCVCVRAEAHPRPPTASSLWFFLSNDSGLQFSTGPQGGVDESEDESATS